MSAPAPERAASGEAPVSAPVFWLGVAVIFAVSIALRFNVADLPLERDEGEYAYIAWRALAGDVPYRDAFDQKPPGIFAVYALAIGFAGPSVAAIHWTAHALVLAALAGIAALGRRLFSAGIGWLAAALAALWTVDPALLGNAANTELVALAPLVGALLAALRAAEGGRAGWTATAGALGGLALLCKPVAAPIVLVALATAIWPARRSGLVRHVAAAGVGMTATLAPVVAWFAAAGALPELWDATVVHNLSYAGGVSLARYPAYFWAQMRDTGELLGPPLVAAALGVALLSRDARTRRAVGWVGALLLASLLAVAAGGYFRRHYFLLAVPPLALLAGAGVDAGVRALGLPRPRLFGAAVVATMLGLGVWHSFWYYAPGPPGPKLTQLYGSNPFPESPALGRFLRENSDPDDRVFVYGSEPQVLFYAQRASASRYIFVYPLNMPLGDPRARQREVLDALSSQPPRFIVATFVATSLLEQPGTPPDLRTGLRAQIERDYEVAAVVPFSKDRSGRVLAGKPARTMWRERPLWDGSTPWAAFVVFERRAPPG